jgi:hypothetical protein
MRTNPNHFPWQNAWTDAQNGIDVAFRLTVFGDSPDQPSTYRTCIKRLEVCVFFACFLLRRAESIP